MVPSVWCDEAVTRWVKKEVVTVACRPDRRYDSTNISKGAK